jgi:hypothetical protein
MTILQGVARVIWLDQREFAPGRAEMNAELRAAAARYPNLDVVDWNAAVAAHPDYVYSDGIHLTASGQQGMADLVHARVAAFVTDRVAALTTTTTSTTSTTTTTAPPATTKPTTGGREGSAAGTTAHGASNGADGWWIAALVAATLLVAGGVVVLVRRRAASRAP